MDEVARTARGPRCCRMRDSSSGFVTEGVNDSKKLQRSAWKSFTRLLQAEHLAQDGCFKRKLDRDKYSSGNKKGVSKFPGILGALPGRFRVATFLLMPLKTFIFPPCGAGLIHGDALCYSIAAATHSCKSGKDRIHGRGEISAVRFRKKRRLRNKAAYGCASGIRPCEAHRRSFIKKILAETR